MIVAIAVVVFLVVVGFVWVRYFGGIGFFQYYLDKLW